MSLSRSKLLALTAIILLCAGTGLFSLLVLRSTHSKEQPQAEFRPGGWLESRETAADHGVWAKETLARQCGHTVELLLDTANQSSNRLTALGGLNFGELFVGRYGASRGLPQDFELQLTNGRSFKLSQGAWRELLSQSTAAGWTLEFIGANHEAFDADEQLRPVKSRFQVTAHLSNTRIPEAMAISGDVWIFWQPKSDAAGHYEVQSIDASRFVITRRKGQLPFQSMLNKSYSFRDHPQGIDPLILYDLDGDGSPEILLIGANEMYHRAASTEYQLQPLFEHPLPGVSSAVVADFDGDGAADCLCANPHGLWLFRGSSSSANFKAPPVLAWQTEPPLENPMAMTCGDIDGDGDLDVFVAQYKVPGLGAVLRPQYYDCNDGFPSYLLQNDGHGGFSDITEASGLGSKRWRRTYSASLADLDADGRLDLVVVSDFAGVDLYKNIGDGRFEDCTAKWVAEPHAFGMGHSLADLNVDGRLDLLMIGMPSATVDRLEHLGLARSRAPEDRPMRRAMSYGNRLYLGRPQGGFEQSGLNDSIARSGWSWGCSAFDFDNDGFPDVYIATGLETRQSVRDYEPEFWLHDIFVEPTVDDFSASAYFVNKFSRTRASGWSYGGHQSNCLYWNQGGESFLEISHLAGVGLKEDSRNVVAQDLDGDGRVDLAVTTLEVWPEQKQTLQVYRNNLPAPGHWIAFQLGEQGQGLSPVGATITLHWDGRQATRQVVTGDSHRSQHAPTVHFGLGNSAALQLVDIRWVGGQKLSLESPGVDRTHRIIYPSAGAGTK